MAVWLSAVWLWKADPAAAEVVPKLTRWRARWRAKADVKAEGGGRRDRALRRRLGRAGAWRVRRGGGGTW